MTMWSIDEDVVTDSHCGYAASAYGGMQFLPAQTSKYIKDAPRRYCAIHNRLFAGGEACGKCYKLKYDGNGFGTCSGTQENHAPLAGEGVIQVVDSGSGNHDFDCVLSTFESITGYHTDRFPIEYEEVECETQPCDRSAEDCILHVIPSMTQKSNGYLGSARVIFFNLPTGIKSVKANIGICGEQEMARNGALWDVSFSVGGCSYKPVIFTATMSDDTTIVIDASEWNQFKDLSWCFDDGVWVNPAYTCTRTPTTQAPTTPQPTTQPSPTQAPTLQASPPQPTTQAPTLQPTAGDHKMMAFVENWLECPTIEQIQGYSHVIVSFAVSYVWQPGKNRCDEQCNIGTPVPICNGGNYDKVKDWQDAGAKVLLSFGGAGMGGQWTSSLDDCWEYCYTKGAPAVASQLAEIVETQGFDGVDIDFEYHVTEDAAVPFLSRLTTDLQDLMPAYKTVSHAPMDHTVDQGDNYYNLMKSIAPRVDYILPQYYNGNMKPGQNPDVARSHYTNLVNDVFGGDASKVFFGFCPTDCSSFNVDSSQAVRVMREVAQWFPRFGGAYVWAGAADRGNAWSRPVVEFFASLEDTPPTPPMPTIAPSTQAPRPTQEPTTRAPATPQPTPQPSPTEAPTLQPTPPQTPTEAPTPAGGRVCLHQKDCKVSSCCSQVGYEQWCRQNGEHSSGTCPAPFCYWS